MCDELGELGYSFAFPILNILDTVLQGIVGSDVLVLPFNEALDIRSQRLHLGIENSHLVYRFGQGIYSQ